MLWGFSVFYVVLFFYFYTMNTSKILPSAFAAALLFLLSCGPAAEDRKAMHDRAKVFQDSIANSIRSTINEAEMPAQTATVAAPTPTTPNK